MFKKKKTVKKNEVNQDTKLIDAYQHGATIQQIAEDNGMTTAEVMSVVVKP